MNAIFFMSRRWPRQRCLLPASLIALCLWLTWLGLNSWTYQQTTASQLAPTAIPLDSTEKRLPAPLDNHNIARVFGALPIELDSSQSSHQLILLASLLGNQPEQSRVLIQHTNSRAFYFQGERLPDGSLLKSVSVDRVVILRNGREQNLLLPRRPMRLLSPHTTPLEVVDRNATPLLRAIENTP